ncbi:MAG: hypothetical protein HY231_21840 [Acidobacteria bacterium]|nr:hypothetical protein [Acidobacteriota bacterium]
MSRTLVTISELTAYLTGELRKVEDCQQCSISRVLAYQQPDEDGCNWSPDVIVSYSPDVAKEYVIPHVQRIVAEARKRFNL